MLQRAVGLVTGSLGALAGRTGLAVVADEVPNSWPGVVAANQFQRLVIAVVTREEMIVVIAEYAESEIVGIRNVDALVEEE